jgi:hypothetical protein
MQINKRQTFAELYRHPIARLNAFAAQHRHRLQHGGLELAVRNTLFGCAVFVEQFDSGFVWDDETMTTKPVEKHSATTFVFEARYVAGVHPAGEYRSKHSQSA